MDSLKSSTPPGGLELKMTHTPQQHGSEATPERPDQSTGLGGYILLTEKAPKDSKVATW